MSSIVCACGKQVPTQPEWAGQWVPCPGCGGSLYAPFPGDKPSVAAAAGATRLCALCAETIPVADLRCRYCGSDPTGVRPAPAPPAAPAAGPSSSSDDGVPVLIFGLIGLVVCQLLCPIAWIMGSSYEARCRARGETPSSAGHAGKIVGMIGTGMAVLGFLWFVLSMVARCH
jgi:hypothetical protein